MCKDGIISELIIQEIVFYFLLQPRSQTQDLNLFERCKFSFVVIRFQGSLEEIQGILNTTEISLHQLTALVDCRSLHMVSGMRRLPTGDVLTVESV